MTECPHCRKHFDASTKVAPRKDTWMEIVLITIIVFIAGTIVGIGMASLVISVIEGKPQVHYPGQSLCEITQSKSC
ncbi:hypothetical protein [Stenotrophomonas phage BUCTxx99]|nr:hypothetical protein [Stenotrophomonas phage BUCTxx99]